jgi:hypothetical protein
LVTVDRALIICYFIENIKEAYAVNYQNDPQNQQTNYKDVPQQPQTNDNGDPQNSQTNYGSVLSISGVTIVLILAAVILGMIGLAFMFAKPAELYNGDAYNGIVANIRGATFMAISSMLTVCAILLNRNK